LSQQACLQSGLAHEEASFFAQHDFPICEQEEIDRRAARVRNDKTFMIKPHN